MDRDAALKSIWDAVRRDATATCMEIHGFDGEDEIPVNLPQIVGAIVGNYRTALENIADVNPSLLVGDRLNRCTGLAARTLGFNRPRYEVQINACTTDQRRVDVVLAECTPFEERELPQPETRYRRAVSFEDADFAEKVRALILENVRCGCEVDITPVRVRS